MPPAGFEPTIPTSERPHTLAVDRAATTIGRLWGNVENYGAARQATDDDIIRSRKGYDVHAGQLRQDYRHTDNV